MVGCFKFFLEYVYNTPTPPSQEALNKFIHVGQIIRKSEAHFKNSFAGKFEATLKGKQIAPYFKAETGLEKLDYDTGFTALAAPSMEGKTQLAFILRDLKPLYFPMSEARRSFRYGPQPIYTNFTNLAKTLYDCAREDFERLGNSSTSRDIKDSVTDLFTVGFLLKLVEESKDRPCDSSWLDFHAKRPGFFFKPVTLEKALKLIKNENVFDGYVLILDEFSHSAENVFIRNAARNLGLPCIVMNTNTKVANIVGKDSASAGTTESIWSLVITKLGPAFMSVLNEKFGLLASIETLTQNRLSHDPLRKFLFEIYDVGVHQLRPESLDL